MRKEIYRYNDKGLLIYSEIIINNRINEWFEYQYNIRKKLVLTSNSRGRTKIYSGFNHGNYSRLPNKNVREEIYHFNSKSRIVKHQSSNGVVYTYDRCKFLNVIYNTSITHFKNGEVVYGSNSWSLLGRIIKYFEDLTD